MSTNTDLAKMFFTMATILEIKGESAFKINANTKVARVLTDMVEDICDIEDLTAISGIGKSSAAKIQQYIQTGTIPAYEELFNSIPVGLLDVIKVQGLGPKTVRLLWQEIGVVDIPSFRAAIEGGKLDDLPRMGKKTIQNISDALAFLELHVGRVRIGDAMPCAEALIDMLGKLDKVTNIAYAGSLRRGKETIGDIDILASSTDPEKLAHAFCTMPNVTKVLAQGKTKCSVRLNIGAMIHCGVQTHSMAETNSGEQTYSGVQVDLRMVDHDAFGAALLYFTGSKEHNILLRERAIKQGKRLNEYGLYLETEPVTPIASATEPVTPIASATEPVTLIAAMTEEAIYEALGLPWIPPEMREDRGELECKETPTLITEHDIQCDLHCHTTASDGHMSIEELVMQAIARGYHTIAITDHSQSQTQANGLKPDRLRKHIDKIRAMNESIKEITILAGSEVDILPDGRLDYDDELLAMLDIVIASVHSALQQSPDLATKRLLRAIEHPLVHIIGHPTGRIINKRKGLEPDMHALVTAASQHNTALEINANHLRLDLRDTHVRAAVKAGAMISINTDTHHREGFDQLRYGILTARRGWLTPGSCVNCITEKNLKAWLSRNW